MRKFHILLLLISTFAFSHTGHQADGGGKIWYFQDSELTLSGDYISSPCNPSGATSTYYMTIFALSETPSSLPSADDLTINYSTLIASFSTVTIIDSVVLEYIATP